MNMIDNIYDTEMENEKNESSFCTKVNQTQGDQTEVIHVIQAKSFVSPEVANKNKINFKTGISKDNQVRKAIRLSNFKNV